MKPRPLLAAILGATLALSACGGSATEGVITKLEVQPAHVDYDEVCVMYSKDGFCTVTVPVPYDVPECLYVEFFNESDDDWGSFCAAREYFDAARVGDHTKIG